MLRWHQPLVGGVNWLVGDSNRFSLALTPLEPQSRFGDKPVNFQVVCPQNGTAALKGLINLLLGGKFLCNVVTLLVGGVIYVFVDILP